MKYKVGDKVKVRSDLNYEKYSEGVPFTSEMDKFKGTVLEVRKIAGEFYEMVGIPYIFTDEMLEPVEEMSAEEAIRTFGEFCDNTACWHCPIKEIDREHTCADIKINHPEEIVKILKQWKVDHEKKDVEVEFARTVRVIEDTGSRRRCVYEEDVTEVKDETFKMTMKRILEEYCKEHEGKFFTVYEEICRVKE